VEIGKTTQPMKTANITTIKAMTCIEIDIEPLLIIGWISVKYSIRQAVAIYMSILIQVTVLIVASSGNLT
jgi:hypothetical protein